MAGTVNKTLEWLNKAVDLDPGHYDSREARALAYYALRKYDGMEIDASVMIGNESNNSKGYALRAIARREKAIRQSEKELFSQVIRDHNKAIKLSPEESELYDQRRQTHLRMGNYEKALSDAQECVQLGADERMYHFHSFCALVALGRYEEAQVEYDTIIKSGLMTNLDIDLSAAKYVSDSLDAGLSWHPPETRPEGAAFLAMHESDEIYEQLAKKAKRVVPEGFHATWSPDGTELAYSRGIHGFSGIEIINLESGKTRLLTVPGFDQAWSPDGQYIAFVRARKPLLLADITTEYGAEAVPHEQREVWIIKSDGTEEPRFLAKGHFPCWSCDSKRVFYHSVKDMKLCSISIEDGAKPTPIVSCPGFYPVVSPDEKYVAYWWSGELRIVELASKSVVASWTAPLISGAASLNWSPNGQELSTGGGYGNTGLWIYELDTKTASKVLSGPIGWSSWSRPDISRFAFQRMYGPLHREIWVADLDPNVSTIEALGPGRTIEQHCQEMVDLYTRRIDIDPEDERNYLYLGRLISNLSLLGMEHYSRGAYEEALVTLTRIDNLRRTVLKNESSLSDMAFIAMALHELGRDAEAEAALARLERLFEGGKHSRELSYLCEAEQLLAGESSKVYLVWESIEGGKLEEAWQLVEELRSLPRQEYTEIARRIQSVIKGLAFAYYKRGKNAEHRDDGYGDAISDYKTAVRVDPNYAPAFDDLAWLWATCPRAEFRDGAKAIENAGKACELADWKDYRYLGTLAAAYAEAGDFQQAIKRQKEAIDLLPEDKRLVLQANYEKRLKLYVSGKPYHKGMIGWWKFDGNARDSSPFQHHGNEIGNPSYAAGIRGRALSLRGDGDHVLVPNGGEYLNGLDALTVCLWLKSNVTDTDKGFIIFENPAGQDDRAMRYDAAGFFGGGTNLIKCGVTSDAAEGPEGWPGRQQLESSSNVKATDWQHLAMTWSSGNQAALYINGKLDRPTWVEPAKVGTLIGYTKLIIGKGGKDVETNESWNGLIDDVRIYSYALSEAETKTLYTGKEPSPTSN